MLQILLETLLVVCAAGLLYHVFTTLSLIGTLVLMEGDYAPAAVYLFAPGTVLFIVNTYPLLERAFDKERMESFSRALA